MPNRLTEIRTRQAAIRSDLDALEAKSDPTEDDEDRMTVLLEEFEGLDTEASPLAERAARLMHVRQRMAEESRNAEPTEDELEEAAGGAGGAGGGEDEAPASSRAAGRPSRRFGSPDLHFRGNTRDPFDDMDSVRNQTMPARELRARAVAVIEKFHKRNDHWGLEDAAAQNAETLVMKRGAAFGAAISRQMLLTGGPEYLAAFENYLTDPGGFSTRAALSLTPANGGYLVPFTLDPTIILTNAGSANPYRQLATIKTTATNNWNGVTSAGVNAEWTAEGVEASDMTPTLGQLSITPQKADAYLFGSFEVLSDSDFASELPGLLADAKDRLEETAFAVGTGTGQPKGVIPAGTSASLHSTSITTGPNAADIYGTMALLPARWRGPRARNAWVMNLTTINALRQVQAFSGATVPILQDEGGGNMSMLGKPVYESTSVSGAWTPTGTKILVFGDFSQFYIVDRVGMSIVYDPVVLGTNRRPTGQGAWYAFWRVGSDVSTATAFRVGASLT